MKRFWITVAAVWLVFTATVLGLSRVLQLARMPFEAFSAMHSVLLAFIAIATIIVTSKQFLRPRSPKLLVVVVASLLASAGAVVLTFMAGRVVFGFQFAYVVGLVGHLELLLFLFVCAVETVCVTAAISKADREHHSDEFGRFGSAAIRGVEMPAMAAPTMITIDGIVERESGITPPPPVVSVTAIAITLGIMILIGIAILAFLGTQPKPDFDSWGDVSMSCRTSASA